MKQLRQISFAVMCLGLGFWLHLVLAILRGDHGRTLAREMFDCLPSAKSGTGNLEKLSPEQEERRKMLHAANEQHTAERIWKSNIQRRERIFGKGGVRLKRLRTPANLTPKEKAMWHPAAFWLDYYRPTYSCLGEERLGLWTRDGSWVCRPNDLSPQSLVYTFGSKQKLMAFETEIYRRKQPEVHVFSPDLPPDLRDKLATREEFHYHAFGIAETDSTKYKRLQTLMRELQHAYVDVLRLDCEGCELTVLKQILQDQVPVGQILVSAYRMTDPRRAKALLSLMEKHGFRLFHLEQDWRRMHVLLLSYIHESICTPVSKKSKAVDLVIR